LVFLESDMKRFAVLCPAILLAGLAACTDKAETPTPTSPVPTAAVRASVSSAPVSSGSTVCLSYVTKRAAAEARLKHSRELRDLGNDGAEKLVKSSEAEVEKVNDIIADACN
jgi:hypothetical protein